MRRILAFIKFFFILAILYLFFFLPLPFYLEVPGRAFGLDEMVEVDHKLADDPGEFYITTVGIQQSTPFTALSSVLPFRDLVSKEALFGDMENFEDYDVIQKYYMDSSINTAIQVAFDEAGREYELHYNGVYVLQVLKDSFFSGQLKVGDTVKAVDGHFFENSHAFIDYIGRKDVGETVELLYERGGEILTATGPLIPLKTGVAGIGIGLVDNTSIKTNPEVLIHSKSIGGPSAGLMFSLQIYNQLTGENIHGDYKIAGTGTIAPDGTVGRIGGIDKKVVASDKEGADYFFAPDDELDEEIKTLYPELQSNFQEAVDAAAAIKTKMEIIPIKNIKDALEFLEKLNQKEQKIEKEAAFGFIPLPIFYPNAA